MKSNCILLLFVVALSLGLVLGESELITPPAEEVTSSAKPLRNDDNNNRDLWYHPWSRGWSSSSGKSGKSGSKSTSHPTLFPTLSPTLYPTMYPTLSPTYCGKSGKSGGGGKGGKSCSSSWSSTSWDWRGATKLFQTSKIRTDPSPSDTTVDTSKWGDALGEEDSFARKWLELTGGGDEATEEEEDPDVDTSGWEEAFGDGGRDLEQDNSMLRRRINGGERAVIAEQEP